VVVIYARGGPAGNSLCEYALKRGWDDIEVVSDAEVLTRLVRLGKVEVVLCSGLSGLGRSVPGLVRVLREFLAYEVTLIVPGQINTSSMPRKVLLDTLDAVEEFKRAAAVEAINEGLVAAKARGVRLGRPVKIDRYREDVARLRAQGFSGRAIAKELGVPSANVFKVLRLGVMRPGETST
jgi:DNA invertase Pin-like site-specific DNA recombinase